MSPPTAKTTKITSFINNYLREWIQTQPLSTRFLNSSLSVLHTSSIEMTCDPQMFLLSLSHRMWVQSERDPPYCRTPGLAGILTGLSWPLARGPEPELAAEELLPLPLLLPLMFVEVKAGSLSALDQDSAGLSGRWMRWASSISSSRSYRGTLFLHFML